MRYLTSSIIVACALPVTGLAADAPPQRYPNLPPPPVVMENDKVLVQRMPTVTAWTGPHEHDGRQLAVVIEPFKMTVIVDGEEREEAYEAGDVIWLESLEHDHRAQNVGQIVLITLK